MKPQISELATRDFQEHTPKGNRFTREINRDAYNVTNTRKERVPNRAGIKKKNTGKYLFFSTSSSPGKLESSFFLRPRNEQRAEIRK